MIGEVLDDCDSLAILLQDTTSSRELRESREQNAQLLQQNTDIMRRLDNLQHQVELGQQGSARRRRAERVQVSLPTRVSIHKQIGKSYCRALNHNMPTYLRIMYIESMCV